MHTFLIDRNFFGMSTYTYGQFLTYTKIRTRVPPHQNLSKANDKIKSTEHLSAEHHLTTPETLSSFR